MRRRVSIRTPLFCLLRMSQSGRTIQHATHPTDFFDYVRRAACAVPARAIRKWYFYSSSRRNRTFSKAAGGLMPSPDAYARAIMDRPAARELIPHPDGESFRWIEHDYPCDIARWNYHPEVEIHLIRKQQRQLHHRRPGRCIRTRPCRHRRSRSAARLDERPGRRRSHREPRRRHPVHPRLAESQHPGDPRTATRSRPHRPSESWHRLLRTDRRDRGDRDRERRCIQRRTTHGALLRSAGRPRERARGGPTLRRARALLPHRRAGRQSRPSTPASRTSSRT